jgi:hypothetical protein
MTDNEIVPRDWGVAWFGDTVKAGVCQRCQLARPVYKGYNGGQPMGVEMCGNCRGLAVKETRLHSERNRNSYVSVDDEIRRERSLQYKMELLALIDKFPVGSTVCYLDKDSGYFVYGLVHEHTGFSSRANLMVDGKIVRVRYLDLYSVVPSDTNSRSLRFRVCRFFGRMLPWRV